MNRLLHLFYFGIYIGILSFGYQFLDILLPILSKNYKQIKPVHKKIYVCSNVLKAFMFCIYTTDALYLLYSICINGTWDVERVQYLGMLYTGLDAISLWKVPSMQLNTKIHHISVIFLHMFCLYYNYEVGEMLKIIIIYAIWSANAYFVNLYLGLRVFISEKNKYLHHLCICALITYIGCTILNWTYQTYALINMYMNGLFPIGGYLYLAMMGFIIYDDIILMKYLYKRIMNYYKNRAISFENLKKLEKCCDSSDCSDCDDKGFTNVLDMLANTQKCGLSKPSEEWKRRRTKKC